MSQPPNHNLSTSRANIRMDARLDAATRQKVDDLAHHFHRPRAAVLCQILEWGLSHEQSRPIDQGAPQAQVRHLHLYVPSDLHEQVEKAAAATGVKTAVWLRHMVGQIATTDFPASWQEATPPERSHDSRIYTARFMLRLDTTASRKLQALVDRLNVPKAKIIRHLLAQAEPEDFPQRWHLQAAERQLPRVH